jgi:hypothetical protein
MDRRVKTPSHLRSFGWAIIILLVFKTIESSADDANPQQSQSYFENRVISSLAFRFRMFEIEHPNTTITNWTQLLTLNDHDVLFKLQTTYEVFGPDRGFENSILEKYVLMPPGVIVDDQLGGEIVMIGAQTFPGPDGLPLRAIVAKLSDSYRGFTKAEVFFQQWVGKAGVEIPKPVRMPPIAKPIKSRSDMTAEDWYRENRNWIDPILKTTNGSNSPATLPAPRVRVRATDSATNSIPIEPTSSIQAAEPGRRDPRWGLLAVGALLSIPLGSIWIFRRR